MTSPQLLQMLKAAHLELQTCFDEMDALTIGPAVSRSIYSSARFRISCASLKRRAAFNAVCEKLNKSATAEDANVIARLRGADAASVKRSAQHVRDWPAERIDADWRGYCKSSRLIRNAMAQELRAVEQQLFPLLAGEAFKRPSNSARAA